MSGFTGRFTDSFTGWRAQQAGPVNGALPTVGSARDNGQQETTNASRPRAIGADTPARGLADRLETTDS